MKKLYFLLIGAALLVSLSSKAQITVDLKAWLEGPYFSGTMTPWLNVWGFVPLNQPYNTGPWHYFGTEQVTAMPNADVVDWVLVEIRKTLGPAYTAFIDSTVARQAGFILKNGKIVGLDGVSKLQFNIPSSDHLYAVVRHRNHLNLMSATPLPLSGGNYTYDFSTGAEKAYGGQNAHKQIATGVWGKIAGDGNADGNVNNADKVDIWRPQSGNSGYLNGDFNLNSQVDNPDKIERWGPNSGRSSQVPGWATVPPGNTNPVAVLQVSPASGSTNTIFNLDASASYDAQTRSSLLAVRWDFNNDGTWDTPYGYGKTTTYHYQQPGSYTIKLEVIDMGGLTDAKTHTMNVTVGIGCEGVDTVNYAGKTYHAVEIGTQCWLKENLDVGTMINGNNSQTNNGIIEKYCYDNNTSNCDIYGGLYQWNEMMKYVTTPGAQGICPAGWHLPTDDEWKVLEGNVDSKFGVGDPEWDQMNSRGLDAGGNLKDVSIIHWLTPNVGATNSSGFTALGGGNRHYTNFTFNFQHYGAYFWSSSEFNSSFSMWREIDYLTKDIIRGEGHKNYGYSVRCLRDYINLPPAAPSNPVPATGATNVDIPNLSWSCSDPNGDIIRYSIYFGTASNPPLLASNQPYPHFTVTALNANTLYRWRIVATDMQGDSTSGATWSFTTGSFVCGMTVTDNRPAGWGENYPTVLIGNQCWMAKNMNYGYFIDGSQNQTNNGTPERYCYDDLPSNCTTYGGLYQWDEMMQYSIGPGSQGICPSGWHIPTDQECKTLEGTVDSRFGLGDPEWDKKGNYRGYDAGGNLKETGTVHWFPPNTGATNSSGYTALPGGFKNALGPFQDKGYHGLFWVSENSSTVTAWYRSMNNGTSRIYRSGMSPYDDGMSVRCLRDPNISNLPPTHPSNPTPPNNATNRPVSTILSWSCSDPDGDVLVYDIYLSTDSIPVLVKANHTDKSFDPLLHADSTYFWRVVAKDPHGNYTAGETWQFTTKFTCGVDELFDSRDGQSYRTTKIGNQCWMAENLNAGIIVTQGMSNDNIIEKYCYGDIPSNCEVYGGMYPWNELMQYSTTPGAQGVCPNGWHVPTHEEWMILEGTVDSQYPVGDPIWIQIGLRGFDAGKNLKATWSWNNSGNGIDLYGFAGIGGGAKNVYGSYEHLGNWGSMWTSTQVDADYSWLHQLTNQSDQAALADAHKNGGYNVRCINNNPEVWNCGDVLYDPRDSQSYNTVQIGSQCWMQENLNIGSMVPGSSNQTNNSTLEKYCYDNSSSNCDIYGGLYQWDEAMQYTTTEGAQGLCPSGWHLPTDAEWCMLEQSVDPTITCSSTGWRGVDGGGKLKEAGTVHWASPNTGATNSSAFTGLPGGYRDFTSSAFLHLFNYGYFWSSSESGTQSWLRGLGYNSAQVQHDLGYDKNAGISVRCVKDTTLTWSCGDPIIDSRDNQTYNTVQIGSQCWMQENLNIGTMVNGSVNQANNGTIEKYCYGDNAANCNVYGGLYQWNEMMQYSTTPGTQGICPPTGGWHLPTDDEWCVLEQYVDPTITCTSIGWRGVDGGGKLKEAGLLHWASPNTGATNASGFTVLPAGIRNIYGNFDELTYYGRFWSSVASAPNATGRSLFYNGAQILRNDGHDISTGFSVRCVKDTTQTWSCGDPLLDSRDNSTYNTVQIGTQCWMAENLNIGSMIPGSNNQANNGAIEKYCYDNNTANCDTYGGLYQWNEMMQYVTTPGVKGICPDGWHLPTDAEYCTLTQYIDPTVDCGTVGFSGTDVGTKMKSTTGWYGGGNGTNASDFTALPGGVGYSNGYFSYLTYSALFWSSSENISSAWSRQLICNYATIYRIDNSKSAGFSVRCEKD